MRRLNKIVDNTGGLLDEAKQAKNALVPAILSLKTCRKRWPFVVSGRRNALTEQLPVTG